MDSYCCVSSGSPCLPTHVRSSCTIASEWLWKILLCCCWRNHLLSSRNNLFSCPLTWQEDKRLKAAASFFSHRWTQQSGSCGCCAPAPGDHSTSELQRHLQFQSDHHAALSSCSSACSQVARQSRDCLDLVLGIVLLWVGGRTGAAMGQYCCDR